MEQKIKTNEMYYLLIDEEKGYFIEPFDSLKSYGKVSGPLSGDDSKRIKYFLSDFEKYEKANDGNDLYHLAYNLRKIVEKGVMDGLQIYIDKNYGLWVKGEVIIPEAYGVRSIWLTEEEKRQNKFLF